jgi:parvulin-like peptidyl-prolyl isomerase
MIPGSLIKFIPLFCGHLLVFLLFFPGCDFFNPAMNQVVVVVGSRQVGVEDLKADMEFISAGLDISDQQKDKIRGKLLDQLIDHYLILEYGKEKGISVSDGELQTALQDLKKEYEENDFRNALFRAYIGLEKWKKRLEEQICVKKILKKVAEGVTPPLEEEARAYYHEHRDRFKTPQMVKFRQIVTKTRKEAEGLLKRLHKGADMGELAKRFSIAPEAVHGGVVDWVVRDYLDESMEKALFSLKQGKISPVTKTPYGYHIFQVLSLGPEGAKEYSQVKNEIESELFRQRRKAFYGKWLGELRRHYHIKINHDLFKAIL